MCKIFTSIIHKRLYDCSESNKIIDEAQAGFRRGYSTIDNIFTLQSVIQKYISKGRGRFYCLILFVDFSKAYDRIDHSKLWKSLSSKGINGKILAILKAMYARSTFMC